MKNLKKWLGAGVLGMGLAIGGLTSSTFAQANVPEGERAAPADRPMADRRDEGFNWGWLGLLGLAGLAGLMARGSDHRAYRDTDVNRPSTRP